MQKDEEIYDWHLRNNTIIELEYAINKSKSESRPFYVMSGFRKPHAPWQAPQRMYDLYNQSSLAVAEYKVLGKDTPLIAWSHQLGVQLENGTGFQYGPTEPVPDWVMQDQRHAYYASISYVRICDTILRWTNSRVHVVYVVYKWLFGLVYKLMRWHMSK